MLTMRHLANAWEKTTNEWKSWGKNVKRAIIAGAALSLAAAIFFFVKGMWFWGGFSLLLMITSPVWVLVLITVITFVVIHVTMYNTPNISQRKR